MVNMATMQEQVGQFFQKRGLSAKPLKGDGTQFEILRGSDVVSYCKATSLPDTLGAKTIVERGPTSSQQSHLEKEITKVASNFGSNSNHYEPNICVIVNYDRSTIEEDFIEVVTGQTKEGERIRPIGGALL
jgi:hypothetical protein